MLLKRYQAIKNAIILSGGSELHSPRWEMGRLRNWQQALAEPRGVTRTSHSSSASKGWASNMAPGAGGAKKGLLKPEVLYLHVYTETHSYIKSQEKHSALAKSRFAFVRRILK